MSVFKNLIQASLLCGLVGLSSSTLAFSINVNLHSSVEIEGDSDIVSHNENSPDSVYSYVTHNDSYSAVQATNGNGLVNVDAFLSASLANPAAHTSTKISAKLKQTALITNSLNDAKAVSFDFLIAAGHLSNIFRSGLGPEDDQEHLSIDFCADILLNGTAIWSTKAVLLQNKSTRLDYKNDNLLSKSGFDLNSELAAGVSDGFYSWKEKGGRLDLGVLKPGESIELEYSIGLIVSGKRKNCNGDSLLCEEERLYNTASQVRFGGDDVLKGMAMNSSTITAAPLYVNEPGAWMLLMISLAGVVRKFRCKANVSFG